MNRRTFFSLVGAGTTTAIAGCTSMDSSAPEATGREESTQLTEEELEERTEEELETVHNQRVNNGQLVHSHNLNIISVDDITDDTVTLETTFSINPVDDYTINLHYNPITTSESGEWVHEPYTERVYGRVPPEYDDATHEWVPQGGDIVNYVQYTFENTAPGDSISSFTVPSEAFWDDSIDLGTDRTSTGLEHRRENIHGYGWSYVNEHHLDFTPELYETFVLTLSWEDENTISPHAGEVVANTPPMMRVGTDTYVYPRTHNGNSVVNANWDSRILNDDRNYEEGDIYINDIQTDSDLHTTGHIIRLSSYGYFTPKTNDGLGDSSVSLVARNSPAYLDAEPQYPWSVSFNFSRTTRNDAVETANQARTGNSQSDAVHDFINTQEVMNHDLIQDIASQLGDVCDIMNANHPSEQVRVVADFVQYLNHTSDGQELNGFGNPLSLYGGTSHPVELLYRGGVGDCKDFTVLGNALLQQDPFNMNPSAAVIPDIFQYVSEGSNDENSIGHVSTTIPVSEMDFDEIHPSDVTSPINSQYETVRINGVEHVYIEMSGPFPIGYVYSDWIQTSEFVPLGNYVR